MIATKDVLSDIRQHPERDDLRLEYADACEAKDPDYARYIRAEIAWARAHLPELAWIDTWKAINE